MSSGGMYGREEVDVRETHASWVFLAGDRAYKLRKPIRLDFLDYSTLELRHRASLEEIRVNEELAPGIYLGVRAICRTGESFSVEDAGDPRGEVVDYVVEMRRFSDGDTLAGLIAAHRLTQAHVDAVARRVAQFHRGAAALPGGFPREVLELWRANVRELAAAGAPAEWSLEGADAFAEAFVGAHARELDVRRRSGMTRDGHGDLRCEHVLALPSVRIVDRIEFDPSLRRADTASDLAFLSMDLEASGQRWAAQALVSSYRGYGMDPGSDALLAFYAAHRAVIRAKVALIAAGEHDGARRAQLLERARSMWAIAELLAWRARMPAAIIVCGAPATGKSTLAAELSRRSGIEVVSSDAIRKAAAGLKPMERAGQAHYSESFTRRTYELVADAAQQALLARGAVIVDATCRTRAERALLGGLRGSGIADLLVRCDVPLPVAVERAQRRAQGAESISDADAAVVAELHGAFEPVDELPPASVLDLDGRLPLEEQVRRVTRAVDGRLAAAVAG
jgi:aminoglycoside phosphotransferase family enzyme/predicted kinase